MRVAITGAGGRLGRALVAAFAEAPFTGIAGPLAWDRSVFDLDDPAAAGRLIAQDRPEVVIHAAAWTDVDACARQPELALRRNGTAVGELARACVAAGVDLVTISTNEVFDGTRTDGQGYRPDDRPNPPNPYGASKLAGELAAREAFGAPGEGPGDDTDSASGTGSASGMSLASGGPASGALARNGSASGTGPALAIVRTAWLYGPPGNDFPAKILAAAERARAAGEPLRVVSDEFGSPTSTADLAEAVVELVGSGAIGGTWHVVNAGAVSRADWAREVLRLTRTEVPLEEVPAATWPRASTAPRWAVLEPSLLPSGEPLRPWHRALADQVPWLLRARLSVPRSPTVQPAPTPPTTGSEARR